MSVETVESGRVSQCRGISCLSVTHLNGSETRKRVAYNLESLISLCHPQFHFLFLFVNKQKSNAKGTPLALSLWKIELFCFWSWSLTITERGGKITHTFFSFSSKINTNPFFKSLSTLLFFSPSKLFFISNPSQRLLLGKENTSTLALILILILCMFWYNLFYEFMSFSLLGFLFLFLVKSSEL